MSKFTKVLEDIHKGFDFKGSLDRMVYLQFVEQGLDQEWKKTDEAGYNHVYQNSGFQDMTTHKMEEINGIKDSVTQLNMFKSGHNPVAKKYKREVDNGQVFYSYWIKVK